MSTDGSPVLKLSPGRGLVSDKAAAPGPKDRTDTNRVMNQHCLATICLPLCLVHPPISLFSPPLFSVLLTGIGRDPSAWWRKHFGAEHCEQWCSGVRTRAKFPFFTTKAQVHAVETANKRKT